MTLYRTAISSVVFVACSVLAATILAFCFHRLSVTVAWCALAVGVPFALLAGKKLGERAALGLDDMAQDRERRKGKSAAADRRRVPKKKTSILTS